MKYTIKEFFESNKKLAINVLTEEVANKLCEAFHNAGYRWVDGESYSKCNIWYIYKEKTCYGNDNKCSFKYAYTSDGYTILTIKDIILEEENVKMEKVVRVFEDLESGKKVKYEVQEDGTLKELKVKLSKFIPKLNQVYYFVNSFGDIQSTMYTNCEKDKFFFASGNLAFETQEQAQEYLNFLNLLNECRYDFTQEEKDNIKRFMFNVWD